VACYHRAARQLVSSHPWLITQCKTLTSKAAATAPLLRRRPRRARLAWRDAWGAHAPNLGPNPNLGQERAVGGDEAEGHVLDRSPRGQDAAEARVQQRSRQRAHQRRGEGEEEQEGAPQAEQRPCAAIASQQDSELEIASPAAHRLRGQPVSESTAGWDSPLPDLQAGCCTSSCLRTSLQLPILDCLLHDAAAPQISMRVSMTMPRRTSDAEYGGHGVAQAAGLAGRARRRPGALLRVELDPAGRSQQLLLNQRCSGNACTSMGTAMRAGDVLHTLSAPAPETVAAHRRVMQRCMLQPSRPSPANNLETMPSSR